MALRILFAPDSGALVGGGHVMRCLTLAGVLKARGCDCAFAVGEAGRRLVETFAVGVDVVEPGDGCASGADVVVVDSYRIDAAGEDRLRGAGARIVVLDDLADRPHRCDLLVDPSLERTAGDYRGLVPEGCGLLVGPAHALVRPAFAALRERAKARRDGRPVARALVCLGLTDVGGLTGRVVETLRPLLGETRLDVVVGATAPSLAELEASAVADARLRLWIDATEMARLMLEADVAIGAGGSSTWERACLGLPSICLILADNQRLQALGMAARGAAVAVEARGTDFPSDLSRAWRGVVADARGRARMSQLSFALCDGAGAARVAGAILELAERRIRA